MRYTYPEKVEELSVLYNQIFTYRYDWFKSLNKELYKAHQEKCDELAKNAARVSIAFNRTQTYYEMDNETAQFWIDFYTDKLDWEPIVLATELAQYQREQKILTYKTQLYNLAKKEK